jgi:hypothetical protein
MIEKQLEKNKSTYLSIAFSHPANPTTMNWLPHSLDETRMLDRVRLACPTVPISPDT